MHTTSRRGFIAASSLSIACGVAAAHGVRNIAQSGSVTPFKFPNDADRIRTFVGACHAQIDVVREMLAEDPDLAKASWDWGFGDHENAIGACSHTGRVDIIELLLEHGARPTIFTLATLDKHAAVRGFIESMPGAHDIEGPHSISLYRHAQAGNAKRVMAYLERSGLNQGVEIFRTNKERLERFLGRYKPQKDAEPVSEVAWVAKYECLSLKIGRESSRNLIPLGVLGAGGATPETDLSIYSFRPAGSRGAIVTLGGRGILTIEYAGNRHVAELFDQ